MRKTPHPIPAAAWLVACVFLTACGSSGWKGVIGKEETIGADENAAIVIMGQGVRGTPGDSGCNLVSFWRHYQNTKTTKDFHGLVNAQTGCGSQTQPIAYSVFKIPPGHYILNSARTLQYKGESSTIFFEAPDRFQFSSVKSPKFEVKKGEVIYIGDLIFDKPYPARLKAIEQNDEQARTALTQSSQVRRDFVFRPATQP